MTTDPHLNRRDTACRVPTIKVRADKMYLQKLSKNRKYIKVILENDLFAFYVFCKKLYLVKK